MKALRKIFNPDDFVVGHAYSIKEHLEVGDKTHSMLLISATENELKFIACDQSIYTFNIDYTSETPFYISMDLTENKYMTFGGISYDMSPLYAFFKKGGVYTASDVSSNMNFIFRSLGTNSDGSYYLYIATIDGRDRIYLDRILNEAHPEFKEVYKAGRPSCTFLKYLDNYKYKNTKKKKEKE